MTTETTTKTTTTGLDFLQLLQGVNATKGERMTDRALKAAAFLSGTVTLEGVVAPSRKMVKLDDRPFATDVRTIKTGPNEGKMGHSLYFNLKSAKLMLDAEPSVAKEQEIWNSQTLLRHVSVKIWTVVEEDGSLSKSSTRMTRDPELLNRLMAPSSKVYVMGRPSIRVTYLPDECMADFEESVAQLQRIAKHLETANTPEAKEAYRAAKAIHDEVYKTCLENCTAAYVDRPEDMAVVPEGKVIWTMRLCVKAHAIGSPRSAGYLYRREHSLATMPKDVTVPDSDPLEEGFANAMEIPFVEDQQ